MIGEGKLGPEIGSMQSHFAAQAEGRLPYSQGFVVVGQIGKNNKASQRLKGTSRERGIISLQPNEAMVQDTKGTVTSAYQRKRKRSSHKKHKRRPRKHRRTRHKSGHRKKRRSRRSRRSTRGRKRRHRRRRHRRRRSSRHGKRRSGRRRHRRRSSRSHRRRSKYRRRHKSRRRHSNRHKRRRVVPSSSGARALPEVL